VLQPMERWASWPVTRGAREVLERADQLMGGLGGRPAHVPFVYEFGKPVTWRLWGMWGLRPERRVPFRVWLHVADAQLHFRAQTRTEGYLLQLPAVEGLFDRAVAPLLEALDAEFR